MSNCHLKYKYIVSLLFFIVMYLYYYTNLLNGSKMKLMKKFKQVEYSVIFCSKCSREIVVCDSNVAGVKCEHCGKVNPVDDL